MWEEKLMVFIFYNNQPFSALSSLVDGKLFVTGDLGANFE